MDATVTAVGLGTLLGALARLSMLRVDYRQYPSYPQAYVLRLTLGAIAAFLGAVAIPALLAKDFAAGTFLSLAATQFREVRNIERETLTRIESTELVVRGTAYIEGIARVFEARNYIAMVTATLSTGGFLLADAALNTLPAAVLASACVGAVCIFGLSRAMRGLKVADMATVRPAEIEFDGPTLVVAGNRLMNVGSEAAREKYRTEALAVVIEPKDPNAKATLANTGQRQALAHNAAALLGVKKDVDTPEFTPIVRRNIETGEVNLVLIPAERDMDALLRAVLDTPVLEGAYRRPLAARAARMVD